MINGVVYTAEDKAAVSVDIILIYFLTHIRKQDSMEYRIAEVFLLTA